MVKYTKANNEMKEKIFEETEYTNTLNYMINREKKILEFKHKDMEAKLHEFSYLVEQNRRAEYDLNQYKLCPAKELDKYNPFKQAVIDSREQLFKLRMAKKMQEVYLALANKDHDGVSAAMHDHNQNEINRKKDLRSKNEREKEFHHREETREKYLELLKKTNASILKDLVKVTADRDEFGDSQVQTFDVSKECRIDEFFSNEEVFQEDAEVMRRKNEKLKKIMNDSQDSSYEKNLKLYTTREYLLMIKETMDIYQDKKQFLEQLKVQRDHIAERKRMKESEMSKKVTNKIIKKKMCENDPDYDFGTEPDREIHGSEYATDVTSQEDRINAHMIPTMNDEVERILLHFKRKRDEIKNKLLKSKELVSFGLSIVTGHFSLRISGENMKGDTDHK